jgi:hypothetical protein
VFINLGRLSARALCVTMQDRKTVQCTCFNGDFAAPRSQSEMENLIWIMIDFDRLQMRWNGCKDHRQNSNFKVNACA